VRRAPSVRRGNPLRPGQRPPRARGRQAQRSPAGPRAARAGISHGRIAKMIHCARAFVLGIVALGPSLAVCLAEDPALPPSDTPKPAAVEITETDETFPSRGKKVTVERFEPKANGKYPVVVVLHGHGGIGPPGGRSGLREEARLLAREGYVALIPHY